MAVARGFVDMFEKQEECDVFFKVDGKSIGAHRLILKIRSQPLYEMTKGCDAEQAILIEDMDYDTFEQFLGYIYAENMTISNKNFFMILFASTHFKVTCLEKLCCDHIQDILHEESVCHWMNEAINFGSEILQEMCRFSFSQNTKDILTKESFLGLSQPALSAFLDATGLDVDEAELFGGLMKWMEKMCDNQNLPATGLNRRLVIGEALYKIRFPVMTCPTFANQVCTVKGLLTDTEKVQVFEMIMVENKEELECVFPEVARKNP